MAGLRLKHVERFRDRHGRIRFYYRKGHGNRIALEGEPGTREFADSYEKAAGLASKPKAATGPASGSFSELIAAYLAAPEFLNLKKSTQAVSKRILDAFGAEHGHAPYRTFKRQHLDVILARKSPTPAAANNLLKKIRVLINFAHARNLMDHDPARGIKKYKEGAHHTWTEAEISQFEKRWPIGSPERTAFALHLYTGQRRSDVCRMKWTDIRGDLIHVVQEKTATELLIPIHPDLRKVLRKTPRAGNTIITTKFGNPRSEKAYGGYMAHAIDQAGLPERCVLHGLRKAAARRLAEAGCSASQIASVTGHKTLEEVSRYTRGAEQEHLARAAMAALKPGSGRQKKAK